MPTSRVWGGRPGHRFAILENTEVDSQSARIAVSNKIDLVLSPEDHQYLSGEVSMKLVCSTSSSKSGS